MNFQMAYTDPPTISTFSVDYDSREVPEIYPSYNSVVSCDVLSNPKGTAIRSDHLTQILTQLCSLNYCW